MNCKNYFTALLKKTCNEVTCVANCLPLPTLYSVRTKIKEKLAFCLGKRKDL